MVGAILNDAVYMLGAIDQAIYGLVNNPSGYGGQVGCLIVAGDGSIISKAYNMEIDGKRFHAEEIALRNTNGADLSDATMYVTMEPCNGNIYHDRRHCCEQITDRKLKRVVMANRKLKYEGGADHVRKSGIVMEKLDNDVINSLCGLLVSSDSGKKASYKAMNKVVSLREEMRSRLGY
jgi:pyrimidine deaminase RibD-like protein